MEKDNGEIFLERVTKLNSVTKSINPVWPNSVWVKISSKIYMLINGGKVSSLFSMEILFLGNRVTFLGNQTQISVKSEFLRKKSGVRRIPISGNSEIRRSLENLYRLDKIEFQHSSNMHRAHSKRHLNQTANGKSSGLNWTWLD